MKKFAMFVMLVSLGLFTLGCGETKKTKPADKSAPAAGAEDKKGDATPTTPEKPADKAAETK